MNFRIIPLGEVTSTNDVAMSSSDMYNQGTILTAIRQTAGRGQRGNRWHSPAGENLTLSLIVEPKHILVEHQFQISEMAALAAAEAIEIATNGRVECRIKWPNDLYVGDRKVGGILIEHSLHSEYLSRSVIGIGINVHTQSFDPSLPNPTSIALSLQSSHPPADIMPVPVPSPDEVLQAFCRTFAERYAQDPAVLHSAFMARLWRGAQSGEGALVTRSHFYPYRDVSTGEVFQASIEGVDRHTGELTLRLPDRDGELRRYWFKEVEAVLF